MSNAETTSQAVAKRENGPGALISQYRDDFTTVLPSHMNGSTWVRLAQGVLRRDKQLAQLAQRNPGSLMQALLECARLGHEPGTPSFYLVPMGGEIEGWEGYRGVIERMFKAGAVTSVKAEVVKENDRFVYQPHMDRPEHEVEWFKPRGEILGAYAYAEMRDGGTSKVVVIGQEYIAKVRAESKGSDKATSPWRKWPDAMVLKGLALDTPIPTPGGWTTMGQLSNGDAVFDMHGQPTRVNAVSEVKHLDCYRVTFANGSTITCDGEHRWLASIGLNSARARASRGWDVHSIADLYEAAAAGSRITMPVTTPLATSAADLPIDPWVLGYWLGNGRHDAPTVTCHRDHHNEVIAAISSAGYQVGAVHHDTRSQATNVGIRGGLRKVMANAGLLGHKHVPAAYLRGSTEQRLALLRGLMDSDGSLANKRGRARFVNTDHSLALAVAELARSLGEMVNGLYPIKHRGYGKEVVAYHVSWQPTVAPVTISAKLAHFTPRTYASYRSVRSIERVPSVPTRCISVESSTRTYLAGADMVPTHNTVIHRLEPFVPTSSEYLREQMRVAREVAAEGQRPQIPASRGGDGSPVADMSGAAELPASNSDLDATVVDAELVDPEAAWGADAQSGQ